MKKRYVFGLGFAHSIWCRPDLEPRPANMERVAEVLQQAGIEVYEVRHNWLACEPYPAGIWEALTGKLAPTEWAKQFNCPPEQPGRVLKFLADKGVLISDF